LGKIGIGHADSLFWKLKIFKMRSIKTYQGLYDQGILTEREGSVDLLLRVACFILKVSNIFSIKRADLDKLFDHIEPSPSIRFPCYYLLSFPHIIVS
jgi:hypothetical protein